MFVPSHTAFTICGYVLISHYTKFPVSGYIFSSEVSILLQYMLEMHVITPHAYCWVWNCILLLHTSQFISDTNSGFIYVF